MKKDYNKSKQKDWLTYNQYKCQAMWECIAWTRTELEHLKSNIKKNDAKHKSNKSGMISNMSKKI